MNIQIYCLKRNFDVQKAERFFKERRVPYQLVDLKKHALGQKELALFARAAGSAAALLNDAPETRSHPAAYTDDESYILDTLREHPQFLRTPVVRNGDRVAFGADEAAWSKWLNSEK